MWCLLAGLLFPCTHHCTLSLLFTQTMLCKRQVLQVRPISCGQGSLLSPSRACVLGSQSVFPVGHSCCHVCHSFSLLGSQALQLCCFDVVTAGFGMLACSCPVHVCLASDRLRCMLTKCCACIVFLGMGNRHALHMVLALATCVHCVALRSPALADAGCRLKTHGLFSDVYRRSVAAALA